MTESAEPMYRDCPNDPNAWITSLDLQMTIDGRDAVAKKSAYVVDPCTEMPLVAYCEADLEHVDTAVSAAQLAFPDWAARPWADRRAALKHFAERLLIHQRTLALLVACESGRPLRRAWAEVTFAVDYVRTIAATELPPIVFERAGVCAVMKRKPLGVVAAIAPWNGPVILAVAKIANALLAGDTQVLRPSPFTPLSALYMGQLGRKVFPPGVLNVITGDVDVGAKMTVHPGVAKISFTGSTATGKQIAAAAAASLKRLTLELGGNDAAIVLPDADAEAVADTVFRISLGNAGHFCAAIKRLYIHEDIYDALKSALLRHAADAVLGSSFDPTATMGPVQNRPQFDRIWSLFDDAVAHGARVLTGGERWKGPGLFIPPTLVEGVGHGVALVDEEQFGPVLPLIPFHDVEEAIRMANSGPYGLGGSLWTQDVERGIDLVERLEVGTGWVNQHGAFTAALPMPFAKQSGIGMDYAEYGVAEHSRAMLVNARLA